MAFRIVGWKLNLLLEALARTGTEKQNTWDAVRYGFSAKRLLQVGPSRDTWFSHLQPVHEWQGTVIGLLPLGCLLKLGKTVSGLRRCWSLPRGWLTAAASCRAQPAPASAHLGRAGSCAC